MLSWIPLTTLNVSVIITTTTLHRRKLNLSEVKQLSHSMRRTEHGTTHTSFACGLSILCHNTKLKADFLLTF